MKASVVMATFNKGPVLGHVLESIFVQPQDGVEVIVVDDGSTDETKDICNAFPVVYLYLDRPYYTNPAMARNVGYRQARGEVVIAQSSDTVHSAKDTIERLCEIVDGTFNIATVWAMTQDGRVEQQYTGELNRRPLFFLGSLRREDLYAIGGDDEDFTVLGCEDDWFADRLTHGLGLSPVYRSDIEGAHLWHPRPSEHWEGQFEKAKSIYADKITRAKRGEIPWCAPGGPWPTS